MAPRKVWEWGAEMRFLAPIETIGREAHKHTDMELYWLTTTAVKEAVYIAGGMEAVLPVLGDSGDYVCRADLDPRNEG